MVDDVSIASVIASCDEAIGGDAHDCVLQNHDFQQDGGAFFGLQIVRSFQLSQLFWFSSALSPFRRTATGTKKTQKLPLRMASPRLPLGQSLLVESGLLKYLVLLPVQVGQLWLPHSLKAGFYAAQCFSMLLCLAS